MALTDEQFAEKWGHKRISYTNEDGITYTGCTVIDAKEECKSDLAEHDEDKRIELSEQLKSENPYPDTVFLPISEKELIRVAQYLKDGGFSPDVSQRSELLLSAICQFTKRTTQKEIQEVEKWIETDFRK